MTLSSSYPSVSILIKTYDNSAALNRREGFPTLRELLEITLTALEGQTSSPQEILVIDSSANDRIAEAIRAHISTKKIPIRRIPLSSEIFNHPRALNLGVQQAQGEIVVSLSGDATPANSTWLENLLAPLSNAEVAGAYSRQVVRPGMSLSWIERFRLWWRYRSQSTRFREKNHLFSNACSAFRRDLALRFPFNESLFELEDYEWAREVQRQGYTLAYVGNSEVFHSHISSRSRTLWRMVYYVYLRMKIDAGLYSRNRGQDH